MSIFGSNSRTPDASSTSFNTPILYPPSSLKEMLLTLCAQHCAEIAELQVTKHADGGYAFVIQIASKEKQKGFWGLPNYEIGLPENASDPKAWRRAAYEDAVRNAPSVEARNKLIKDNSHWIYEP